MKVLLDKEDQALWDAFIQENSPLKEREEDFSTLLDGHDNKTQEKYKQAEERILVARPSSFERKKKKIIQSPQLDRRTAEKLRKGKIQIEARLDLHGKTQNQAHELLNNFIGQSARQGLRCVLVITGKGKSRLLSEKIIEPEVGILKKKVPEWLEENIFAQHILRMAQAHPKDGGSGALYVYLKRQR